MISEIPQDQKEARERVAREVEQFLAKGGEIKQVPTNVYQQTRLTKQDREVLYVDKKQDRRKR